MIAKNLYDLVNVVTTLRYAFESAEDDHAAWAQERDEAIARADVAERTIDRILARDPIAPIGNGDMVDHGWVLMESRTFETVRADAAEKKLEAILAADERYKLWLDSDVDDPTYDDAPEVYEAALKAAREKTVNRPEDALKRLADMRTLTERDVVDILAHVDALTARATVAEKKLAELVKLDEHIVERLPAALRVLALKKRTAREKP